MKNLDNIIHRRVLLEKIERAVWIEYEIEKPEIALIATYNELNYIPQVVFCFDLLTGAKIPSWSVKRILKANSSKTIKNIIEKKEKIIKEFQLQ